MPSQLRHSATPCDVAGNGRARTTEPTPNPPSALCSPPPAFRLIHNPENTRSPQPAPSHAFISAPVSPPRTPSQPSSATQISTDSSLQMSYPRRNNSRSRGRYDENSRSPSPTVVNSSNRSSSVASTVSLPREQEYGRYDHARRDQKQKLESIAKVGILVGAFAIIMGVLHLRRNKGKPQVEHRSNKSREGDRDRRRTQRKEHERRRGQEQYDDWQERTNRPRIEDGSESGAPTRRIEYNDAERASSSNGRRSRR